MREHRIRRRADFLHGYDKGRRYFSETFVLFAVPRPERAMPWRMGTAVTKKCGCAVLRNRVKRLIRESFRLQRGMIADGYDYIVVPKRGMEPRKLNLAVVSAELTYLLRTAARGNARPVSS